METFYGTTAPPPRVPRIAALGMFDGVHRGHQRILQEVRDWAAAVDAGAAVLTFDRHPLSLLDHEPPPCITSLEHRVSLLERLGLDLCLILPFDDEMARTEPEAFAQEVLCQYLAVRGVVMGFDQRFGRGGRGDGALMRELGERYGFEVRQVPAVVVRGRPISSTALREAIAAGEFDYAEEMLGRRPSLRGTVVHGAGRGRQLGFPTANLDLHHEIMPPPGVYLTRTFVRGCAYPSLTHVGARPTFVEGATARGAIESYLHGFRGQLYGQDIEVELYERVRDTVAFRGGEELRQQMERDRRQLEQAIAAGRI